MVVLEFEVGNHRSYYLGLKHWPSLRCLLLWYRRALIDPVRELADLTVATHAFNLLRLRDAPPVLRQFVGFGGCAPHLATVERTEQAAVFVEGNTLP